MRIYAHSIEANGVGPVDPNRHHALLAHAGMTMENARQTLGVERLSSGLAAVHERASAGRVDGCSDAPSELEGVAHAAEMDEPDLRLHGEVLVEGLEDEPVLEERFDEQARPGAAHGKPQRGLARGRGPPLSGLYSPGFPERSVAGEMASAKMGPCRPGSFTSKARAIVGAATKVKRVVAS